MKKSLNPKASGETYWIHSSDRGRHYIGTGHVVIAVQSVDDKLRKILALYGLYESGRSIKARQAQAREYHNNVDNMLAEASLSVQLEKTPYLYVHDKTTCRVFLKPDGSQVLANETYIAEVESFFGNGATWYTSDKYFAPLVYGENRLGMALPIRVPNHGFKVVKGDD